MRKTSSLRLLLALATVTLVWKMPAATAVVRTISDARAWSILPGDSRVLTWRWSEGATAATLLATNVVTGASALSAEVVRDAELDASCEIPLPGAGLFDVTLRETAGEDVVLSKTVRLKIGQPETAVALDKADGTFRTLEATRPYAWDAAWFTDAETPVDAVALRTADKNGAALGAWTFPGPSGWDVLSSKRHFAGRAGRVTAVLSLDGVEAAMANLNIPHGLMMYLR